MNNNSKLQPGTLARVEIWHTVGSFNTSYDGIVVEFAYTCYEKDWYKVIIEHGKDTIDRTVARDCIYID